MLGSFSLATLAFGVFPLFLPLATAAFGGPEGYFSLAIMAFGVFGFIVPKYYYRLPIPVSGDLYDELRWAKSRDPNRESLAI